MWSVSPHHSCAIRMAGAPPGPAARPGNSDWRAGGLASAARTDVPSLRNSTVSVRSSGAEIMQDLRERLGDAREDRGVAQSVDAALRLAQLHHEVEEILRFVRLERHDEFLVVHAEGVRRVQAPGVV